MTESIFHIETRELFKPAGAVHEILCGRILFGINVHPYLPLFVSHVHFGLCQFPSVFFVKQP